MISEGIYELRTFFWTTRFLCVAFMFTACTERGPGFSVWPCWDSFDFLQLSWIPTGPEPALTNQIRNPDWKFLTSWESETNFHATWQTEFQASLPSGGERCSNAVGVRNAPGGKQRFRPAIAGRNNPNRRPVWHKQACDRQDPGCFARQGHLSPKTYHAFLRRVQWSSEASNPVSTLSFNGNKKIGVNGEDVAFPPLASCVAAGCGKRLSTTTTTTTKLSTQT